MIITNEWALRIAFSLANKHTIIYFKQKRFSLMPFGAIDIESIWCADGGNCISRKYQCENLPQNGKFVKFLNPISPPTEQMCTSKCSFLSKSALKCSLSIQ